MDLEPRLDLTAEYDNRARVPQYPQIVAGWERDSAAYRAERAGQSELGLAYGAHPRQTIDLFHPDRRDEEKPLIVFIHGGYWRSFEPGLFSHFAGGANAHGFSVAMPGYRLCPEVGIDDIIADVRAAFQYLHRRLGRRMVVCGHSAGGHLTACMLATDWSVLAPQLPPDLARRGLAISGVFELEPLLSTPINETLRLDADRAAATSPARWRPAPDTVLEAWVGATESSEFLRQSRLVAENWAAKGAQTRYVELPGEDHFTAPGPLTNPASAMTQALVAICEGLRGPT